MNAARELRDQATRLRKLADELTAEACRIERRENPDALGGRELAEHGIAALRARGPMHYRQLAVAIQEVTGRTIRGEDPAATLLANLSRAPEVRSAGRGICAVEDRQRKGT